MKIVITGGYGFIGSHFVELVNRQFPKANIVVIDKLTYCANPDFIKHVPHIHINKDINDVTAHDLDSTSYVVNFAAESHVDNSIANADPFISSNINGAYKLLKTLHRSNPGARFVQVSTDEVYGSLPSDYRATEHSHLNPTSPYAASKAAADHIAMSYYNTFGMDVLITRSSNNYGPNQYPEKLIPAAISRLLKGKKAIIYGRGEEQRDWIHVEDNCSGILACMVRGKSGNIYNIGSGQKPVSNINIIENIAKLIYPKENYLMHVDFIRDPRPGHDFRYNLSTDRLWSELKCRPAVNLEDGLKSTVEWYVNKFKRG